MKLCNRLSLVALLLCAFFTISYSSAFGQGRVDKYTVTQFNTGWTDISSTGNYFDLNSWWCWNSGTATLSMPFDFVYDNTKVAAGSSVKVNAAGTIAFGSGPTPTDKVLGSAKYPGSLCFYSGYICIGDGDHGDNGDYYETDGTAPNRVFTIQVRRVHHSDGNSGTNESEQTQMQVKLYEGSGVIEFLYYDHNRSLGYYYGSGGTAGIGLNGFTSPSFTSLTYTSVTSTPGADIRFTPPPPPAQLTVAPKELDFGPVIAGNSVTLCTSFSDVSVGTLKILSAGISGNPDFTITGGPSVGDTFQTNKGGQYCITFDPIAGGNRSATFTLNTNGQDSGSQSVTLKGIGIAPGIDAPVTSIFIKSRVRVGDSATVAVPIHSTGTGFLTITGATVTGANPTDYVVSSIPTKPIASGAWDSIYITFKPSFEGRPDATIIVNSDALNLPQFSIRTFGVGILPRFMLSNPNVSFDSVPIGQQVCLTDTIINPGSDNLVITRNIYSFGDYDFTFTPISGSDSLLGPGASRPIQICFTPLQQGTRVGTIRFSTNIPRTYFGNIDTSEFAINLTGIGVPSGLFSISGQLVDSAIVGMENCITDTITNKGSAPITLTDATLMGSDTAEFHFSGLTLPLTIPIGGSQVVDICLTPTQRGPRTAALFLRGTTAGSPTTVNVDLNGFGLQVCATANPSSAFSTQKTPVGSTDTASITVTNCGDVATTYTAALPAGTTVYSIIGSATSAMIVPGGTATFQLAYVPTSIGVNSSTLAITGGVGVTPMSVALGGTGSGVIAAAVGGDAGSVMSGDCQEFNVTITNNGNVDWTPGTPAITGVNAGDFSFVSLNPTTITPGSSGVLTLKFCPTTQSPENASVSFPSSSPALLNSPAFVQPITGAGQTSNVTEVTTQEGYRLGQNYPNPISQTADVAFTTPTEAFVTITIVDPTGRTVQTVVNGRVSSGDHVATINARILTSGTYYCVMTSNGVRLTRQFVVVK